VNRKWLPEVSYMDEALSYRIQLALKASSKEVA